MLGYLVACLFGCLVALLLGYLVAWLRSCLVTWLLGYMFFSCLVAWLLDCLFTWLLGYLVACLPGYLVTWLLVPLEWKEANIIPLFKKGSRNKSENYRPVSLTSVICKLLERLIKDHLVDFLVKNKLINHLNMGF